MLLRRRCTELRDGMDLTQRRQWDQKICTICQSLAVFRYAEKVLCYHPIRSEVDLTPVMKSALDLGKQVYLPLVHKGQDGVMTFHRILSFSDLKKGSFGVMEIGRASCRERVLEYG